MHIGILSSHPIQYQAPLFRALAQEVNLKVFFAHNQTAVEQAKAGYEVAFEWDIDLLTGYPSQFLQNQANNANVFHFNGCDTPEIAEIIRTGNFDVFIVTGWYLKSYWQAIRACRQYKVPVLVRGDSQLSTHRSLLKRLAKELLYRWVMRQFDGFLYVGKRNLEYLLHYGALQKHCFFTPHCIDVDWFRKRSKLLPWTQRDLRETLGILPGELMILSVGRLIEMKRPLDLLRAGRIMVDKGIPIRIVYVGSGPLENKIRHLGQALDVPISMVGFKNQTELAPIYSVADVFALPSSSSETWGLVVNEAMACSTPVVISDAAGCVPDMIVPGKTGSYFSVGDIQALAASIEDVIKWGKTDECVQSLATKCTDYSVQNAVAGIIAASFFFTLENGESKIDKGTN